MDIAVLVLFSVLLLLCVIADISVVYAMLAGYLLFSFSLFLCGMLYLKE